MGSIPSRETKILHATWPKKKKKRELLLVIRLAARGEGRRRIRKWDKLDVTEKNDFNLSFQEALEFMDMLCKFTEYCLTPS